MVKAVFTAIMCECHDPKCLLEAPPAPRKHSSNFIVDRVDWTCMPTSKPFRVKYIAYKKADDDFIWTDYHPGRILSGLDRLKIKYGNLLAQSGIEHSGSTMTCTNRSPLIFPVSPSTSFN